MSEEEIEGMEFISQLNMQSEFEEQERWKDQDALLDRLKKPTIELTRDELVMRDVVLREQSFHAIATAERDIARSSLKQSKKAKAAEIETDVSCESGHGDELISLRGLFEKYVAHRRPNPATVKAWRPVIEQLIDFIGHDDASRLSEKNVRDWRDALLDERAPGGQAVRGGRTVRERHIAALRVILDPNHTGLRVNVAASVGVRVPPRVRLRRPEFTSDEALAILRASLARQSTALAPETALARRWVPWLCAYSGARVNELTQLRGADVSQREGVWTFNITPDAGSVKTGKARIVPIHEHLIEQGFLSFVEGRGTGPLFYDPKRWRGGSDGNPQVKKVSERLASWVRSIGVVHPEVQPNHGWRHLFRTTSLAVRMQPEVRDSIMGHAPRTEGEKYGSIPLSVMAEELGKMPRWVV